MTLRPALQAALVIAAVVVAGCSGGGGSSSSTTPSASSTSNGPDVITYTQTTTISGTVTTITSTTTQTTTTTGTPITPGVLPAIFNVSATPAANAATIEWNVTGGVGALSSHVEYGFASLANFTAQTATVPGDGKHSASLTGLSSCNDYRYRIDATDGAGTIVHTGADTFTTTAGPALAVATPSITVPPAGILDTGFTVQWTVAGPADVKSHVEYGLTAALGSTTVDTNGPGTRTAIITGLSAGQTYNYKITATSPCGSASFPSTPLLQKTATVLHVDINNGASIGGAVNAYCPGSTAPCSGAPSCPGGAPTGAFCVSANTPYVFDLTNKDTATHNWKLTDSASPAHDIGYAMAGLTAGNTYHFPIGVALPAGSYHMRCTLHSGMDGIVYAS